MNYDAIRDTPVLVVPIVLVFSITLAIAAAPAHARHGSQVVNMWGGDGPALQGYDPVAYFTLGKATKGAQAFTHKWLGAEWRFANAEHRDLFAANPTKYAPQHGGYCSVGAAKGGTFAADPEAWRIVDGKLYLFFSEDTVTRFDPDSPEVTQASTDWQQQLIEMLDH